MLRQTAQTQQTSPVLVTTASTTTSCTPQVGHQVVQATPSIVQNQTQIAVSTAPQQQHQQVAASSGHMTVTTSGAVGVTTVGTPVGGVGVRMASPQVIRQVTGGQMGSVAVATIKDGQGGQQNVLMKVISSPQTTAIQGQLANKVQPPARIGSPAVVKAVRASPSPVSPAAVPLSPSSIVTHGHTHTAGTSKIHIVNNVNSTQQHQQTPAQQQLTSQQQQQHQQQSPQLPNSTQLQPMQNPG